jgi:hypothetical protein
MHVGHLSCSGLRPNAAGAQVLLCRRMGKQRIIAETGARQHGVATVSRRQPPCSTRAACSDTYARDRHCVPGSILQLNRSNCEFCGMCCGTQNTDPVLKQATVCAKFGLQCIVYMGKKVGRSVLPQTACWICVRACAPIDMWHRNYVHICAAHPTTRLLK